MPTLGWADSSTICNLDPTGQIPNGTTEQCDSAGKTCGKGDNWAHLLTKKVCCCHACVNDTRRFSKYKFTIDVYTRLPGKKDRCYEITGQVKGEACVPRATLIRVKMKYSSPVLKKSIAAVSVVTVGLCGGLAVKIFLAQEDATQIHGWETDPVPLAFWSTRMDWGG